MNQLQRSDYEDPLIELGTEALSNLDVLVNDGVLRGDVHAFTHDMRRGKSGLDVLHHTDTYVSRVFNDINPDIVHAPMPAPYLLDAFGAFAIALVQHENSLPFRQQIPAMPPNRQDFYNHIQSLWIRHDGTQPLAVLADSQSFPISLELIPEGSTFAISYVKHIRCQLVRNNLPHEITITKARK